MTPRFDCLTFPDGIVVNLNSNRRQMFQILTRAKHNQLSFASIEFHGILPLADPGEGHRGHGLPQTPNSRGQTMFWPPPNRPVGLPSQYRIN